jgi:hypothetical protein
MSAPAVEMLSAPPVVVAPTVQAATLESARAA